MRVVRTIAELRALRPSLGHLGLVPTMGALHDGHMSLVALAAARCDTVAASIFVNPMQFEPHEDFIEYPRPIEADLAKLEAADVTLAFLPTPLEIYPSGFDTRIEMGVIANRLEGAVRPDHFAGVATVVAKLFNIITPDIAFFGQKDVQQTRVIRQLVRDLNLPVEIAIGPTVREPDGLALSSRNVYLSPADRAQAPALFQGLQAAEEAFAAGTRDAARLRELVEAPIRHTRSEIDYISIADPDTLAELEAIGPKGAVVSLAVRFGTTRLLDNVILG
ncbi:MAG TPA: pantoate--beta-alanine ligase [Sphingomonas sp.]|nr:pantoate--beta-alanine ligase [Sphingomonas sp.]